MSAEVMRPTRVTWCLTGNGFADAARCSEHCDHYDVAIHYFDDTSTKAEVLWRIDPVGTTYLTPEGYTIRLRGYDDEPFIDPPLDDKIIPMYDYWTPGGGAASASKGMWREVWEGARLRAGVVRTVTVPANPARPAAHSLYVRPNGETWRLTDYRPDWMAEGENPTKPNWTVSSPRGTSSNGESLPEDARLVWTP